MIDLSPLGLKAAYDSATSKVDGHLRTFAQIRDLYSGEPPFDEAALREAGRAEMSNINTRGFKLNVLNKLNRWKELSTATKPQVSVQFKSHPDVTARAADAARLATILTEEVLLHPQFLTLRFGRYRDTILYGSGALVFENPDCIYPDHVRRSALIVPADAEASAATWDRAFYRSSLAVVKLRQYLDDGKVGWKADAIRALLLNHMDGYPGKTTEQAMAVSEWEARSIDMDNGIRTGQYDAATIPVIVGFFFDPVKKTVTKRIAADQVLPLLDRDGKAIGTQSAHGETFLYEDEIADAKTLADVFHVMRYTEEEPKLWEQQGYGHDAYDISVAALRVENTALDGVEMSKPVIQSSEMVAGGSQNIHVDRFIHPPAGAEVNSDLMKIDPTLPLAMQARLGQQAEALSRTTPPPSALEQASKQPISAAEARERMSMSSEQEIAEAKLVYRQDEPLLRAVCLRALTKRDAADIFTRFSEVYQQVKQRITDELVHPDAAKPANLVIKILPGVGHGSAQDRQQRLQAAYQQRGSLDPVGRQNIVADYYAEVMGSDRVERYVQKLDPRQVPIKEGHDARQENLFFEMGKTPVPAADDNHLLHAQIHMAFLMERAQAVQQAEQNQQTFEAAPLAVTFEASLPHAAYHIDQVGFAATTEELQTEHKGLMGALAQMSSLGQRLKANAQAQAQEAQKQQQAQMEQQQKFIQDLTSRVDSQALTIQKMREDSTVAFEKFKAAQAIREQESLDKMARANKELESKIRMREAGA